MRERSYREASGLAHEVVGARMESVMLSGAKGLWVRRELIGRPGNADMKGRTDPLETPTAWYEINCRRKK